LAPSSINIHKCAIVSKLSLKRDDFMAFGKSEKICQLLKGAFNSRPVQRNDNIWDVGQLLLHLRSWGPNHLLSDIQIFRKTLALVALVTACRVSELASISRNVQQHVSRWTLTLTKLKKNSSPANTGLQIDIFPNVDETVCPIKAMEEYLLRTSFLGLNTHNMFLTLTKPYHSARPNTLAKHLKLLLLAAGIDISKFSAHSFRSASTSKALANQVSVDDILKRATWASVKTFDKFYSKVIFQGKSFSDAVLQP
jgi:integrase